MATTAELVAQAGGKPISGLVRLPLDVLRPHPANVRASLGELTALQEMAASIRQVGLLSPLLVASVGDGTFELLHGHRRLSALRQAGWKDAPCLLTQRPDRDGAITRMIVENTHRRALTPYEEARAYDALVTAGHSQREVAGMVGRSQTHVSHRLALLNLGPDALQALEGGELPLGTALAEGLRVRHENGESRGKGVSRARGTKVTHFTKSHPLARQAARFCGHDAALKLGPACGSCWERAIRTDERQLLRPR